MAVRERKVGFLANPKVQAIKKNPTPQNGELNFELKFNEKGVSARGVFILFDATAQEGILAWRMASA